MGNKRSMRSGRGPAAHSSGRGRRVRPAGPPPAARAWYRFEVRNQDGGEATEADLYIFDLIAAPLWPDEEVVAAKRFIDDLNALPKSIERIRVHVNSPGGEVFEAVPIANALREHRAEIRVTIEGLAASAATIVTSAGDTIEIAENALMMVHNPWTVAIGEAGELRKRAEALDRVRDSIIATYRWHSELSAEELGALMDAETWMDAEEAVENGFATEIGEPMQAAAHFDARRVAHLGPAPEKYRPRLEELMKPKNDPPKATDPNPNPAPEGDPTPDPAPSSDPAPEPDPTPDPDPAPSNVVSITRQREDQIRAQERERVASISATYRAMAQRHPAVASGIADLERQAIDSGLSAESAKATLVDFLAENGGPEIRNTLPSADPRPKASIDVAAIYAKRNTRK